MGINRLGLPVLLQMLLEAANDDAPAARVAVRTNGDLNVSKITNKSYDLLLWSRMLLYRWMGVDSRVENQRAQLVI